MEGTLRCKTARQFGKVMGMTTVLHADVKFITNTDKNAKKVEELRKEIDLLWDLFQESM